MAKRQYVITTLWESECNIIMKGNCERYGFFSSKEKAEQYIEDNFLGICFEARFHKEGQITAPEDKY